MGMNEKEKKSIFSILAWYPAVSGGGGGGGTYFRERKSDFSLDFPAFGHSILVRARGEVGLRCKGYAWTPVLWSFDNSGR